MAMVTPLHHSTRLCGPGLEIPRRPPPAHQCRGPARQAVSVRSGGQCREPTEPTVGPPSAVPRAGPASWSRVGVGGGRVVDSGLWPPSAYRPPLPVLPPLPSAASEAGDLSTEGNQRGPPPMRCLQSRLPLCRPSTTLSTGDAAPLSGRRRASGLEARAPATLHNARPQPLPSPALRARSSRLPSHLGAPAPPREQGFPFLPPPQLPVVTHPFHFLSAL